MAYPPLVQYATEQEYREHFERVYCSGPIETHDGIKVRFRKHRFGHDFFEQSRRDGTKDVFSRTRAERIDWIKAALEDPSAVFYAGWDKKHRRVDHSHRVVVVVGDYVVVIRLTGSRTAQFVTAFVADNAGTLAKITGGARWNPACAQKNR